MFVKTIFHNVTLRFTSDVGSQIVLWQKKKNNLFFLEILVFVVILFLMEKFSTVIGLYFTLLEHTKFY